MNTTTNYHFPLFEANDTPSWLGDWNTTMQEIDSILKNIESTKDVASNFISVKADIVEIKQNISDMQQACLSQLSALKTMSEVVNQAQNIDGSDTQ